MTKVGTKESASSFLKANRVLALLLAFLILPACAEKKETQQKVRTLNKQEQAEHLLLRHAPGYSYRDPLNLDLAMRIEGASATYKIVKEANGKFPGRVQTEFKILLSNLEGKQITLSGGGEITIGQPSLLNLDSSTTSGYLVSAKCLERNCIRLMVAVHEAEKGATDEDQTIVRRAAMIFYLMKTIEEKEPKEVVVLGFAAPLQADDVMSGALTSAEDAENLRKNAPAKNNQPPESSTSEEKSETKPEVPPEMTPDSTPETTPEGSNSDKQKQEPETAVQLLDPVQELEKVWGK